MLRGSFDTVRITACTLDPGTAATSAPAGRRPPATPLGQLSTASHCDPRRSGSKGLHPLPARRVTARIRGRAIGQLLIDHSIVGPIRTRFGGSVETLTISDSIVQAIPPTIGPEYTAADVYDPALLAKSLTAADPLSQALLATLPQPAQADLRGYTSPALVPPSVVAGLNQLVTGPSLWNPALFGTVAINPALLTLAGEVPSPPSSATLTSTVACSTPRCRWRWGWLPSPSATPPSPLPG